MHTFMACTISSALRHARCEIMPVSFNVCYVSKHVDGFTDRCYVDDNEACLAYWRNVKTTSLLPEMGNFKGVSASRRT